MALHPFVKAKVMAVWPRAALKAKSAWDIGRDVTKDPSDSQATVSWGLLVHMLLWVKKYTIWWCLEYWILPTTKLQNQARQWDRAPPHNPEASSHHQHYLCQRPTSKLRTLPSPAHSLQQCQKDWETVGYAYSSEFGGIVGPTADKCWEPRDQSTCKEAWFMARSLLWIMTWRLHCFTECHICHALNKSFNGRDVMFSDCEVQHSTATRVHRMHIGTVHQQHLNCFATSGLGNVFIQAPRFGQNMQGCLTSKRSLDSDEAFCWFCWKKGIAHKHALEAWGRVFNHAYLGQIHVTWKIIRHFGWLQATGPRHVSCISTVKDQWASLILWIYDSAICTNFDRDQPWDKYDDHCEFNNLMRV